jgi:isopenicillin N synthase-like dioxygenase
VRAASSKWTGLATGVFRVGAEAVRMDSVPLIDVGELRGGSPLAVRGIAAQIGSAARSIGFFAIHNHGIAPELTQRLFAASATFFAQPQAEKDAVSKSRAARSYVGYAQLAQEGTDTISAANDRAADYKESFHIQRELDEDDDDERAGQPMLERNLWPALSGFRATLSDYFEAVHAVAIDLHRALAIDIGTDPDDFVRSFERPLSGLALMHYPPPPPGFEGTRYGAAPHTDWGGFTLLAQDDVGGLEVQRRDDTWIPVDPIPGTLICNIGDALMRWTNDVYLSNPHRVVNRSQRSRYSAAFFCDPSADTPIVPMSTCVSADRPAKYAEIAFADLLSSRRAVRAATGRAATRV